MNFKKQVFNKKDYEGSSPSTLCLGCGHDQISKHIVQAFYSVGVDPFNVAKISGIGCSSKTPNYFLKQSRGFNTIHGRMACVATGVKIANKDLIVLGVSGDGDTGSIGLASFLHTIRKNIPMIYIVENNGVYGLTKGQFSATAHKNTRLKKRKEKAFYNLDLCSLALSAGCAFVARAFSGDGVQLQQLLKLALQYKGFAFIDVISPCVAYGNEKDFPHSFSFMKDRKWPLNEIDIIFEDSSNTNPTRENGNPETSDKQLVISINLPEGGTLQLKPLTNHDPSQKAQAEKVLRETQGTKNIVTGLIYYQERESFFEQTNSSEKALVKIKDISLSAKQLDTVLDHFC